MCDDTNHSMNILFIIKKIISSERNTTYNFNTINRHIDQSQSIETRGHAAAAVHQWLSTVAGSCVRQTTPIWLHVVPCTRKSKDKRASHT